MPGENAIYTSRWYIPDVLHLAPEPTNAAGNSQSDNNVKSNLILVEDVGFLPFSSKLSIRNLPFRYIRF
jgi:hypothetical protein